MTYRVILREEWGAKPSSKRLGALGKPISIVVHHAAGYATSETASGIKSLQAIQKLHQEERKWSDIGYHLIIDGAGAVYEGRPVKSGSWVTGSAVLALGSHVLRNNKGRIGVCLLGCFDGSGPGCDAPPEDAALRSLEEVLRTLTLQYDIAAQSIGLHRDFRPTKCPGELLAGEVLRIRTKLERAGEP
jgi:hypothetical protein